MTRIRLLLIYLSLIASSISCEVRKHQAIVLKNLSLKTIYYLVSDSKELSNPCHIAKIRPRYFDYFSGDSDVSDSSDELSESIDHNLYPQRIKKGDFRTLISSESNGIFVNSISIQEIIQDRYNGKLHVFVISEENLIKYSDQEIIDKKAYEKVREIRIGDIEGDSLVIEYF